MTRTRPYAELSAKIQADPASAARVAQYKQAMLDAVTVAEVLDAGRANVSLIAREEDVYLSTLRGYVEELGGVLELRAVFPSAVIELGPTPKPSTDSMVANADPASPSQNGSVAVGAGEADTATPFQRRGSPAR